MAILNINNLKKEYGIETVLKDFSLNVNQGESVALIGPNGSGKTTIFRIITGQEYLTSGTVSVRNDIEVGYLDQLPDFNVEKTIYQELENIFEEVKKQIKEMQRLEDKIAHHGEKVDESEAHSDDLKKTMREYSALQHKFEKGVGYEYQSKIRQVAAGMGFDEEEIHSKTLDQLSGGEKTRVGLAKLLLMEPDLLLLDEPTNHLDLKSVEWLENYLNSYQGSLLIISHDRYFLDNTVERIVEIKNGKNEDYQGNYSYYQKERKRRYEQRLREYKNQQKKIKELEDAIEQLYIWGRSRDSEKMFKRAKAMEKRLERIDRLEKPQLKGRKMKLELDTEIRGGNDVLFVENLTKSFEDLKLFEDLNFELHRTDKAAIIGDNGTGKSTILRIVMGEINADQGRTKIGTNIYPAYYRQEFEGFEPEDDLITALQRETAVTNSKARDMLASFLFTGEDVFKKVKQLSGGEKSRLRLLQLMSGNYNFLILDEPTNHLDLASREVLEEALKAQELNKYYGDYSYYKEKKKEEASAEIEREKKQQKSEGKLDYEAQKEARSQEMQRQKRLKELEAEIEQLEKNLSELEAEMTAEKNIDQFELLQELKDEYESKNSRLEDLYQEWEEII